MADKRKVLLQFDTDPQASSFDSLVAIDAGADVVLPYGNVREDQIVGLIHGAMFTRGLDDLCRTAAFFGGADYERAERLFQASRGAFFGPVQISLMLDPSGANTTAAAAIRAVETIVTLRDSRVGVFGGTGPVGTRLASLASMLGATVVVFSRDKAKAQRAISQLPAFADSSRVIAAEFKADAPVSSQLDGLDVLLSAGGAGVRFLGSGWLDQASGLRAALDLNAVPPSGLAGIEPHDFATQRGAGVACFGPIGVGGMKMKIHKACLRALFEANHRQLSTREIYEIAKHYG